MLALAFCGVGGAIAFTGLIFLFGGLFSQGGGGHDARFGILGLAAFYLSVLTSVFFNVALAAAATAAFDGERMGVGEALRLAWGKRSRIAAWALITAVVGAIISEIASRLPGGARLVGWLAGAAWGLATIFVIPILAMDSYGAIEAGKRSASLVRRRWGEGLTGNVAISAWTVIVAIPAGLMLGVGGALLARHPGAGLALLGVGLLALVAISTVAAATRQVFAVALYRYAIDAPVGAFPAADLESPFAAGRSRERRKSWILRIGVPILAVFAVLVILVAIFGSGRRTAANGYFHVSLPSTTLAGLRPGSPVTAAQPTSSGGAVRLRSGRIGTVESISPRGSESLVEFHIDPRYRPYVEHIHGSAVGNAERRSLCFGPRWACARSASRRSLSG